MTKVTFSFVKVQLFLLSIKIVYLSLNCGNVISTILRSVVMSIYLPPGVFVISRFGANDVKTPWFLNCWDCRNRVSVPWRRSRIPNAPKLLTNLVWEEWSNVVVKCLACSLIVRPKMPENFVLAYCDKFTFAIWFQSRFFAMSLLTN